MTKNEQESENPSASEPTRYANLFRYRPSGTIFARFKLGGKQVRKSLETDCLELPKISSQSSSVTKGPSSRIAAVEKCFLSRHWTNTSWLKNATPG
jgi:hypothetical protein